MLEYKIAFVLFATALGHNQRCCTGWGPFKQTNIAKGTTDTVILVWFGWFCLEALVGFVWKLWFSKLGWLSLVWFGRFGLAGLAW